MASVDAYHTMKMTSAFANKEINRLLDEKRYLQMNESDSIRYQCCEGETPLIPEYSFAETEKELEAIDRKILILKHAINVVNSTNYLDINGEKFTIDMLLVHMSQINQRKQMLYEMCTMKKVSRIEMRYRASNAVPEYQYLTFDPAEVKTEYEALSFKLATIQMALDRFNQTFEFEAEY